VTVRRRPSRARTRVAIALGSNLGDRRGHLRWALRHLRRVLDDLIVSPFEDTSPVDVAGDQPRYLNAVVVGLTTLPAAELLEHLLGLERQRGRVRRRARPKAPRRLDLDLILYGSHTVETPDLTVPHPRFRERAFVLGPLAALTPRWRDPVTGKTLAALSAPRARLRQGAAARR
jgi:2-amino-4-hydroxy-6-hydroxymethyldihydropteridine diphosphokinase